MTDKEKAKRYDKAIEKARKLATDLPNGRNDRIYHIWDLESIFPELRESEDEKIRKELIEHVKDQQSSFISAPDCRDKYEEEENNKYNSWIAWLEKQGDKCLVNFDEAEQEKYDFVSGQFIECRKSFNEFKEDNSYWLEYIGDDNYIGRSDNILNQKFHITPRQLFTLFTWQHRPKEDSNVNNEANSPTEYGKYVDECLNEASKYFFSEGEDKYSVADLFYAGVRCGKSWFEKQGEQKPTLRERYKNIAESEWFKKTHDGMSVSDDEEPKWTDDEKIRKWLIEYFDKINDEIDKQDRVKILAWLEKQDTERTQLYVRFGDIPSNEKSKIYHGEDEIGDENGVSVYPAFELNGNIVLGLTLPITKTTLYTQQHLLEYDNRPCYLVSGDYVGKGTDGEPLIKNISVIKRLDNYRIKECEKKSVIEMKTPEESLGIDSATYNKIVDECIYGENKPKFHEGEWIVSDYTNMAYIESIDEKNYHLRLKSGYHEKMSINYVDKNWHLWTIDDANEGDVLIDKSGSRECPFVFKATKPSNIKTDIPNPLVVLGYCGIGGAGFTKGSGWGDTANCIYYPATKEQRDLLFQKMKEAGYEWLEETKELKKIDINKLKK